MREIWKECWKFLTSWKSCMIWFSLSSVSSYGRPTSSALSTSSLYTSLSHSQNTFLPLPQICPGREHSWCNLCPLRMSAQGYLSVSSWRIDWWSGLHSGVGLQRHGSRGGGRGQRSCYSKRKEKIVVGNKEWNGEWVEKRGERKKNRGWSRERRLKDWDSRAN